jgi:integrase
VAESNRGTIAIHLRNLAEKLGSKSSEPIDRVDRRDLEAFLQARLRERSPTTVAKERDTVVGFFAWAVGQGYLETSPAVGLTRVKTGGQRSPFRTVDEIEAILARGGLTRDEQWALWDCLYLAPGEIAEVLALVRERATRDVSYVLHAIPAYTGMRRGELLRLKWTDVEFDHDGVVARSRKQSRQSVEVNRRIDLHPELKAILADWRSRRPRGQYVACDAGSLNPLTPKQASHRFWQPLRGTKWCLASRRQRYKLGYHTYRHSFASNLAAAGVDQRVIDELLGHVTEAMRRRYRHLFPQVRRAAVTCFSLAVPRSEARGATDDSTATAATRGDHGRCSR